ncbi:MAG: MEDS domain-containing protein [Chloroflexi bacterium]|nr:MEDS domain-containing protein [Chloroflexota bacterium]
MSVSSHPSDSDAGTTDQVFFGLPDVYVDIGAHVAHFFQGDQERVNILAPYLQAGLESGDQCVLVAEASASPVISDSLKELGVDVEAALASGQLLVSEGGSSMDEMSSLFDAVISRSKNAGREVIRIGGDMTWALGKLPTPEKLLEWEAFYDKYVGPRSNFVALCQYDQSRFGGSAIMCALQTHPLSIIGNIVQENPFYRDPGEVLQELSQNGASSRP